MANDEQPSERLVAQRVRNRIMESLLGLSEGDRGVERSGPVEWFESFFDWFPYEGEPDWYPAMSDSEAEAVREVCKLMQQAIADGRIPKNPTADQVIRSDWPENIAPVARGALARLMERGRFSEEREEDEPSSPIAWP